MVEQGLALLLVIGSLVYAPFLGAIMNKRAGGTAWTFTAFLLCTVSLICGLLAFLSGSHTIVWIFISAASWLGGMGAAVAAHSEERQERDRRVLGKRLPPSSSCSYIVPTLLRGAHKTARETKAPRPPP